MSVIIRLQNLPWTANARDIRNFFTGLAIPEGGVHIIGGEMGDAFIAFSTDEDARCAMLKDREKLMEVQVRLLLSSRAEMQKVIETARQVSIAAAAAVSTPNAAPTMPLPKPVSMPPVPQPPIIGGLGSFLLGQQQQQQQQPISASVVAPVVAPPIVTTPSYISAYQQQAGITLADVEGPSRVERRSPEKLLSSRRRHNSRSRSRSRSRSSSSDDSFQILSFNDRGRKRRSEQQRSHSSERELKVLPKVVATSAGGAARNVQPWAVPPAAIATPTVDLSGLATLSSLSNVPGLQQQLSIMGVLPPVLQSYSTTTSNVTTQNYNLNVTAPTGKLPDKQVNPSVGLGQQQQESIAFANVNPYAQIYPQLFQQQQQLLLQQQAAKNGASSSPGAPTAASGNASVPGGVGGVSTSSSTVSGAVPVAETCYIKISGMCPTTSYSDLRKYFAGLYIPHNGIKIISAANGTRAGIAYIEFSRVSSAQKALLRNNTMFRDRLVHITPIGDEEFERAEERSNRSSTNNNNNKIDDFSAPAAAPSPSTTNVLYVEDLPQLTTEQDIMKMFSATCTIVDILLAPSPVNRREFVAFVLFARENEARSALEDQSRHFIGFRKLRVRASSLAEMHSAKDKQRRAAEQLQKEEQQQREDAEREQISKQLQLQLQQQMQQQQEQQQQQQQQELMAMAKFNNDPRRRNNETQQQQHNSHNNNNNNSHTNMPAFANTAMMHNGNMPFAYQQHQNNGNMNSNNNNNSMAPFGMSHNNNNQQMMQPGGSGNQRRPEDMFVRVHNCEYATRVNDLGELFVSENLSIEHIEMLFNERNQSAGEFIVEFTDAHNAKRAIREFHNRRFRGRGLRVASVTPQEIADRMNKPFMDYVPGGNGPRHSDIDAPPPMQQQMQQQQDQQQQQQSSSRRRGPSRFDEPRDRGTQQQQQQSQVQTIDSDDSSNSKQHFNPFAARAGPEQTTDATGVSSPVQVPNGIVGDSAPPDDGIPDKFNRPGCVVAMRNVPFKADLKDILRFFNDYKLSPDDIIRRFNDDGKPTGDARVAFESEEEARSAFESRRRRQIFNRTVFLDII